MDYKVHHFRSYSELPESYAPLLEVAVGKGFFHGASWFDYLMEHLWDDSEFRLYTVEDATGQPLLLVPLRLTELDGAVPYAQTVASVAHLENFTVMSLFFGAVAKEHRLLVLTALFQALRDQTALKVDVLRLWPVETGSELDKFVGQALLNSGFWVQCYDNSFNRFEDTKGLSFEAYFAGRSSNHRYNVRRRQRNLEKAGKVEVDIYSGDASQMELQRGIEGYILGTVESWQSSSSMVSRQMLSMIRLAAQSGCVRLGVIKLDGRCIAGQFWLVSSGIAHCMRLAYHADYKKLAPGVVLTSHMLAHVLDEDHVGEIDFGLGEDDYKEKWMKNSRDYSGFMVFNPSTRRGLFFAAKHIVGRPVKRFLLRALHVLLKPLRGR